jgi:hypothetical protein
MRDPERPDLSAFGWDNDERWNRMVQRIMWRAAPELQRRRSSAGAFGVFDGVLAWARPALATAAALALLSLLALARLETNRANETQAVLFFRSNALPAPLQTMLEAGELPANELFAVTGGEN